MITALMMRAVAFSTVFLYILSPIHLLQFAAINYQYQQYFLVGKGTERGIFCSIKNPSFAFQKGEIAGQLSYYFGRNFFH
jgi:hypothetical protein